MGALVTGMLELEPSASLALEIGSDLSGNALLRWFVEGSESLALEIAQLLERVFDVVVADAVDAPEGCGSQDAGSNGRMSRLDLGHRAARSGFRLEGDGDPVAHMDSSVCAAVVLGLQPWLALTLGHPGCALRIRLRSVEFERHQVSFGLVHPEPTLPLPLLAHLRAAARDARVVVLGPERPGLADRESVVALLSPLVDPDGRLPGLPPVGAEPLPISSPGAPESTQGGTFIGTAPTTSRRRARVLLSDAELTRHVHITGQTGSGKSSLLVQLQRSWAEAGRGFLLLDPHGTTCRSVIAALPPRHRERVWLVEAGDHENPVPLNPLHIADPVLRDVAIQDLVLVFQRLFDPNSSGIVGPKFEQWLTNGLRGLYGIHGLRTSILDIPHLYRDAREQRRVALSVTDQNLADFWRRELPSIPDSARGEMTSWVTSKFSRFEGTAAMRAILGGGADAIDPLRAMQEKRIILIDLSKSRLGEVASTLLGYLYITRFAAAFLARTETSPYGLFIDEAQNFGAGSLPTLLAEGRKFGAALTLAHQHFGQLDAALLRALDGNVGTSIAFRAGSADSRVVAERWGGDIDARRISSLPVLEAIVMRSARQGGGDRPHTLFVDRTRGESSLTTAAAARAVEDVRLATRRELVEPFREPRPAPRSVAEPTTLDRPTSVLDLGSRLSGRPRSGAPGSTSDPAQTFAAAVARHSRDADDD